MASLWRRMEAGRGAFRVWNISVAGPGLKCDLFHDMFANSGRTFGPGNWFRAHSGEREPEMVQPSSHLLCLSREETSFGWSHPPWASGPSVLPGWGSMRRTAQRPRGSLLCIYINMSRIQMLCDIRQYNHQCPFQLLTSKYHSDTLKTFYLHTWDVLVLRNARYCPC